MTELVISDRQFTRLRMMHLNSFFVKGKVERPTKVVQASTGTMYSVLIHASIQTPVGMIKDRDAIKLGYVSSDECINTMLNYRGMTLKDFITIFTVTRT